jgi:hypothetical protein
MPKPNTQRANQLLAGVTAELLSGELAVGLNDHTLRVDNILLELVRPHPVQPRRVLPEHLHQAFHQEKLTPTQALRELIQLVQVAARQRSHPFGNVLELLAQPENESEELPDLSPEETLLRDLVNLAVTIRDDGQVNPLTVVDISRGASHLYRIETGERRYWATWLLRDFIPNSGSDGTIPCILVPPQKASVFRQAKENTSRSGLTAIAMARQTALLLLSVHGYEIPDQPVNHDFYRQALELDFRTKHEYSERVLSAMGGISRMHFSHYKNLLRLSDEAIELADRHNLEEKRLRYVLQLPSETHVEIIRQIIDFRLTSKQVKELCESDTGDLPDNGVNEEISAKALKIAKLAQSSATTSPRDLARALLQQNANVHLARAHIQSMRQLLQDAEQFLEGDM